MDKTIKEIRRNTIKQAYHTSAQETNNSSIVNKTCGYGEPLIYTKKMHLTASKTISFNTSDPLFYDIAIYKSIHLISKFVRRMTYVTN